MHMNDKYFVMNKKYKVVQSFKSLNSTFELGEELIFKGAQFAHYDETWSYSFKNDSGKYKYLVIWNSDEILTYERYFIKL